ncbi:lipoate--protein ligase family protein [Dactylosporangium darangshiense]|uniref:BPL/LPL catalytic domain-containing protein n=1 Tax=Dactylosporangium darangshiense TaxID=579108 RepID=A0ABP8DRW1_9ACTN
MSDVVLLAGDPLPGGPEHDVVLGQRLLREGFGAAREVLRVYSPAPTAAFSRRDTLRPGYAGAVEAVRASGFVPVVRPQGGSLAVYHPGSVVVDHVHRTPDAADGTAERFRRFAALHAAVLSGFGIDARIGAVPGEYCPGDYSVNLAGTRKIVGSAQRVTRDGWLFSSVVQVTGAALLREPLVAAYAALGYDFDPATAGAAEDGAPGLTVEAVTAALLSAYGVTGVAQPPPEW